MTPTLRERWLAGGSVAVVAPTLDPSELVVADRRVLLVTGDEGSALLLAATLRAPLFLRSTGTRERNGTLAGRAPLVVSSIDSLHLPSYRALLDGELSSWPKVLWGADDLVATDSWAERLLPARLDVFVADRRAPSDAEVFGGDSAIVRRTTTPAMDLVGLGGGLLLGATPQGSSLGGLPIRRHQLGRPFARAWTQAESALREHETGIDLLEQVTVATATVDPRRPTGIKRVGPFFAPAGGVLLFEGATDRPPPNAEKVDAVRSRLTAGGEGAWLVGEARDFSALKALASAGVISDLRPIWISARVADMQRFRRPFVDAHVAWQELADLYGAALVGWSLVERTGFALSDQAPRDLVALAEVLAVRPSVVCDVLMDLDAANLIAARVEKLAFEASPGPHWQMPADEIATSLATPADAAEGDWVTSDGCRTAAWRESAGLSRGDDCGACEVCDPMAASLRARIASTPAPSGLTLDLLPERPSGSSSLDALFSGLGSASETVTAPVGDTELLLAALRGGDDDEARGVIARVGGAEQALAHSLFRFQGPDRDAELPDEAVRAMLATILAGWAPWGTVPSNVSETRPGTFSLEIEDGQRWTFLRRSGSAKEQPTLIARLQGLLPAAELGLVADLATAATANRAWSEAMAGLEESVRASLSSGVPVDPEALAAPIDSARVALESAVGEQSGSTPVLLRVLRAGTPELGSHLQGFLGRGEPNLHQHLAARLVLRSGETPSISAGQVLRWWKRDAKALGAERLGALVDSMSAARRADIAALVAVLGGDWRARLIATGLRLGALPRELLPEAVDGSDPAMMARALVAAAPDPGRAGRLWHEQAEFLKSMDLVALKRELELVSGPVANALSERVQNEMDEREARVKARRQVLGLAEAGKLGEAAELLAKLPMEPLSAEMESALNTVRHRAVARQVELVAPVAAVLAGVSGEDAEDAAFAALEDAVGEGFGKSLGALLSKQHRRLPGDPTRALWLARVHCLQGDWAEGERVYSVAASLRSDPTSRVATEFEGIFLAFEEAESKRGLRWVERMLGVPWHQVLLPHVAGLVDEGVVPDAARVPLAQLLEGTGSPFYSKLIDRLRG